jgi:hypothetical protein
MNELDCGEVTSTTAKPQKKNDDFGFEITILFQIIVIILR